jgi:hypothetical protein
MEKELLSQRTEESRTLTEMGIPVIEGEGSKQGAFLSRVYEQMRDNAESNFFRRPILESFDNLGHAITWLAIPTLEDLKCALYEAGDLVLDGGSEKVFTMQDIETIAYVSDCSYQFRFVPALASNIMEMVNITLNNYKDECLHSGGTTKIFDVDRRAELSQDELFKKYYQGAE